ncbi:hypothetical protein CL635_03345 [bacterium]|nr:hypothetical protein [bacterium]|tara:strand:- start:613 stop:1638 length:1026 start_codon:yes stop_codon:yes gene_type:complete
MPLSKREEQILKSIKVASENNPKKPEFPPEDPKFPATPTYKIKVPGFKNVWLKDESKNPTGTHKDRMAWEIVVTYREFLLAKKRGQFKGSLPQLSIITSGSAAFAIQSALHKYKLPNLKVLVDIQIDPDITRRLEEVGCEIYETDLTRKILEWEEILTLTYNPKGIDVTSEQALDPTIRFYDWMSYEILNSSPEYCFIPFGTGNLYENILNINKKEVKTENHDPRLKGSVETVRSCNFIGATTNSPRSKADKLYSPHLPFVHFNEQWIRTYKYSGLCGPESNVYIVREKYLDKALELAASQGVQCEPSGIAGLALLLQMQNRIPKNKKILIVNTGKIKWTT